MPGPDADEVLVASSAALLRVSLSGDVTTVAPTLAGGAPSRPAQHTSCAYAAWGGQGSFLRDCAGEVDDVDMAVPSLDDATKARRDKLLGQMTAQYMLRARTASGRVIDPVARFHLGNGARLERINVGGNLSARGLRESHGVMVNYRYDLADIEANHEAFASRSTVVASSAVKKLLRPAGA